MNTLPVWSNTQVMRVTALVVITIALFGVIIQNYETLLILIAAIIVSVGLRPIVEWMHRRGVPLWLGVALVYFILFLLFVSFIWYGGPLIVDQAATIADQAGALYADVYASVERSDNRLIRTVISFFPPSLRQFSATFQAQTGATTDSLSQLLSISATVLSVILKIGVTFLLAFFWTMESERSKRVLLLLLPLERRESTREFITTIEDKVGAYTVGQGILCLIIGVASFIAYTILGLPFAIVLAIIAGVTEAIPMIGPIIGTLPAVVVAFSISPQLALYVGIVALVIQQIENTILVPRVVGRSVGAGPVPTMLAFLAFSSLFGILGALITVPVTAIIQLVLERTLWNPTRIETEGRDRLSVLRYELDKLVADVRGLIRRKAEVATAAQDQIEDSIEAIALDLGSLVADESKGRA